MPTPKEAEVIQLLLDWPDAYPPAYPGGDNVSPGGGDMTYGEDWPINGEALKRMNPQSGIGRAYGHLERVLGELGEEHPVLYRAINAAYLDPDVSHSEVDHWRDKARGGSKRMAGWVFLHDRAITWLAARLKSTDLYVRWPSKVVGGNLKQMEERHDELARTYESYLKEGYEYAIALKISCTKHDYTVRHGRDIIKERLADV